MEGGTDRAAAVVAVLLLVGMVALWFAGTHDDRAWKLTVSEVQRWTR